MSATSKTEGPPMATRALIKMIVDRSGSMAGIRTEAEAGIKRFIREQAELTGVKVKISLSQFDETYEHVYGPVKAADAPEYRLKPGTMTALYDAIALGIEETKALIAELDEAKRPDKVVVVIVTDGAENASHKYDFESVKELIEAQKADGWEFIFLAGDLESVKFGQKSGLATTAYDPRQRGAMQNAYATASGITRSHLTGEADRVPTWDQVVDARRRVQGGATKSESDQQPTSK